MSMIALVDYFGNWFDDPDATDEVKAAARELLDRVNPLLEEAEAHGVEIQTNPRTKTCIAGETYGGFRPQSCTQGAPHSSHKLGRAVDIYDPDNALDRYVTDAILESHGLYREAPSATKSWCHLSDKMPPSQHRTFFP